MTGADGAHDGAARSRRKQRAVALSIAVSLVLAVAKGVVGLLTGSLAILSDAAQTVLDLGTSALTFYAVRVGDKPADSDHHFGHAKAESVAALIETGLLIATGVAFVLEAGKRLVWGGEPFEVTWWVAGLFVVSIVADFFRARMLKQVARETGSEALEADALNFTTDMVSAALVLVGLAGVHLGLPAADALVALVIAGFIGWNGIRLARRTIDSLVDTAPAGVVETIERLAEESEDVLALKRARVRPSGATLFAAIDVTVRRTLPFDRVDAIKARFEDAVRSAYPNADVTVTAHPVALDDETVFDKVMLIAARRGLAVHHVTVQHLARADGEGETLSVSLDLEVDGAMTFGAAHDVASGLEAAVRRELGEDVEVESHIEPMLVTGLDARDAGAVTRMTFSGILAELAAANGRLAFVHDVRVRVNDEGLFVTCHCFAQAGQTVAEVHDAVDALERAFRRRVPEVRRMIVHAEPRG
jgi:cation diffusion facilitator family transporter